MLRWKRLAVLATVAGLALTGCTATSATSSDTSTGGTLTLGLLTPATSFSAEGMNWGNESPYGQAVYDGLVRANPDGSIVPWLATSWAYNSDKTVLTMKLRTGVIFTDGTAFDADVAAQNLIRFRDGDSPNKTIVASVADAKATDATTLTITLKAPDPALLNALAQGAGLEESPKAFTSATIKTVPVGSGPYILDTKNTVVGSSYTFTKNPKYWAPKDQHYAKLVYDVFTSATALLNAVKGGQVNGSTTYDNTTLDQVTNAGFTVLPLHESWFGLILFDRGGTAAKPLSDVRVRQAINYAFDTKALLKAVGKGYGEPTSQIFPTNSPGYDKALDSAYAYNPTKAKQLMADAGYANGFEFNTESATPYFGSAVYALIQQQLAVINIKVTPVDAGNNFIADMLAPKYPASLMQLQEDPTSWQILNFELTDSATFNPYHYKDATVAALANTIQNGTQAEADAATKKLNAYIVQQAWFAPWYRTQTSFVVDKNTTTTVQQDNAYPYIWNFKPKA